MKPKIFKGRKGFVITIIIVLLAIIFVFGLTVSSIAFMNAQHVKKDRFNINALNAAESGLSRGIKEIAANPAWDGTISGSSEQLKYNNTLMSNGFDTYTVFVYNNISGSLVITTPSGISVPVGSCYIESVGRSSNNSSRTVSALLGFSGLFDNGIFTRQGVTLSGNITIDAYNSSTGQTVPGAATVGTNGFVDSSIVVNGSAVTVDGTLLAGPGAGMGNNEAIVLNGNPTITGDPQKDSLPEEKYLPPVELPQGLVQRTFSGSTLLPGDYSNAGTLNINNSSYTLIGAPGGSQYIFNSINGTGNGKLQVDVSSGPVKIYFTGDVSFTANSGIVPINYGAGMNPNPADIMIYMSGENEFDLRGRATVYGVVYAPDSSFELIGNTNFYGGVIANTVRINGNDSFRFDVNLKNLSDFSAMSVRSWQYH